MDSAGTLPWFRPRRSNPSKKHCGWIVPGLAAAVLASGCFGGATMPEDSAAKIRPPSLWFQKDWASNETQTYGFRVLAKDAEDPGCSIKYDFALEIGTAGPALIEIRRRADGSPYSTWIMDASPAIRAHYGPALDTEPLRSRVAAEEPAHRRAGSHLSTSEKQTTIDQMVVGRGILPQYSKVSVSCTRPPTDFKIFVASTLLLANQGTIREGAGLSACLGTCSLGVTAAREEAISGEVLGSLTSFVFHSFGNAITGTLSLANPEGAASWTFPASGSSDSAWFEGLPGAYTAKLDLAKGQTANSPGGYTMALVGWSQSPEL